MKSDFARLAKNRRGSCPVVGNILLIRCLPMMLACRVSSSGEIRQEQVSKRRNSLFTRENFIPAVKSLKVTRNSHPRAEGVLQEMA
jgi:hypothetical protein